MCICVGLKSGDCYVLPKESSCLPCQISLCRTSTIKSCTIRTFLTQTVEAEELTGATNLRNTASKEAMAVYWSLFVGCLLFGLVQCHTCTEDSQQSNDTEEVANRHTTDPRWRVLSGLDAAGVYALYSVSQCFRLCLLVCLVGIRF